MTNVASYEQVKGKGFARKGTKPRQGSRRWVTLSDGSVVKWWRGEWRFSSTRWRSAVTTSLQTRSMNAADEKGREEKVEERYTDFDKFARRMVGIVGAYNFLRMVEWIKG